jgi:pyruvate formate lyase activating enzyme
MNPAPREEFYRHIDAANIDLKAFSERFYEKITFAKLAAVLDTLEYLRGTDVWFEITTLLIPGQNDSDDELRRQCDWLLSHLGSDVPLHFSAFHPDFKMRDIPATPPSTLRRARQLALDAGLRFVYTGNVHDPGGQSTHCPGCAKPVIVRDWYDLRSYDVTDDGQCVYCGHRIPGVFDGPPGDWGRRRLPVSIR